MAQLKRCFFVIVNNCSCLVGGIESGSQGMSIIFGLTLGFSFSYSGATSGFSGESSTIKPTVNPPTVCISPRTFATVS
jgi:hypothetical protein